MTKEKQQKIINDIMEEFDFKKVRKIMKQLDWTWWKTNGVPKKKDLKRSATNLLIDVLSVDDKYYFAEGGGFRAEKKYIGGEAEVTLSFILEQTIIYAKHKN